jgi:hypothetical protein
MLAALSTPMTSVRLMTPVVANFDVRTLEFFSGLVHTFSNPVVPSLFAFPLRTVLSAAKDLKGNLARNLALETKVIAN